MKTCPFCGKQWQDYANFCTACGSSMNQPAEAALEHFAAHDTYGSKPDSGVKFKIIIGALAAIVLITGGIWGWLNYGTGARAQKQLDLAVQYLCENDYANAVQTLNAVIKSEPDEAIAYLFLARIYTLQGNYDNARQEAYDKWWSKNNKIDENHLLQLSQAGLDIEQGKFDEAGNSYLQIFSRNPDCLEAYQGAALAYQQKGDNATAESMLQRAFHENSAAYQPYNALALFLKQNNRADEAFDNLTNSLGRECNQQEAYLILNDIYQGRWPELRAKASSITNKQTASQLEFYSYYAGADYAQALTVYRDKLANHKENRKAMILAATAMVKTGDKAGANTLVRQVDIKKLNEWLLIDLAGYYMEAGDREKAGEYARQALQANPTVLDAIAILQSINGDDASVKIYSAWALLYNWKPVNMVKEEMKSRNLPLPGITNSLTAAINSGKCKDWAGHGNIANGAVIMPEGGWIYGSIHSGDDGYIYSVRTITGYSAQYGKDIELGELYKMRPDGSERVRLSADSSHFINVAGDWIYYANGGDEYKIYKMRTDGSARTRLNNDRSEYVNVSGDWISYRNKGDGSRLYKIRTDGSGRTRLCDDCAYCLDVAGDWVFFNNKKIRIDGSGMTKLTDDVSTCINVAGDWIFYGNGSDNSRLYKVRTDGSGRTKLSDAWVSSINVAGDWVFFSNGSDKGKLYVITTDGKGETKLNDDKTKDIIIAGEWIYYHNGSDNDRLYKIKLDGSDRQPVQ
ncbi:MAG: DUF5050 domain-containing protein [Syntrophomonas sp.]